MGKDEVWWEKKNSDFEPKNKISGHFGKKIDVSHRKNDKFYMGKGEKLLQIDKKHNIFNGEDIINHNKTYTDVENLWNKVILL